MRWPYLAVVLAALSFPLPIGASQPTLSEWVAPIDAALGEAPGGGQSAPHDRVEELSLRLDDGSEIHLAWSASARLFVDYLARLEARAPVASEGYDVGTGLNRFTQKLGSQSVAAEHWADHHGGYRLVMITSRDADAPINWLTAFDTYRRAGGFGGWPLLTPPLPAP